LSVDANRVSVKSLDIEAEALVERDGVDVRFPDGQLDAGEAERERSRRSSVASAAD